MDLIVNEGTYFPFQKTKPKISNFETVTTATTDP